MSAQVPLVTFSIEAGFNLAFCLVLYVARRVDRFTVRIYRAPEPFTPCYDIARDFLKKVCRITLAMGEDTL
jgi:hypothetical protein